MVIALEVTCLIYSTIYVHDFLLDFLKVQVPEMFIFFVHPMLYILGFTAGVVVVKYPIRYIKYYLKVAQIIFITTLILDYKPYKGSRYLFSLGQAYNTMISSIATDFSVRQVIKVFSALRDSIMKADIFQRFLNPKSSLIKIVTSMTSTGVKNTMSQVDEIILSYTWFTYSLYERNMARQGKKITVKNGLKNRALFFLEGITFTVRVLPHLLVNSLVFEFGFVVLANTVVFLSMTTFIYFTSFTWLKLFFMIVLFKTFVNLFYYVFIDSFRLIIYINVFYKTLEEMEPFNMDEALSGLLGKVPVLKKLVKKSGKKVEPSGQEGESIMDINAKEVARTHLAGVAAAFNLDPEVLVPPKTQEEEDFETTPPPVNQETPVESQSQPVPEPPNTTPPPPENRINTPSLESILEETKTEDDIEELETLDLDEFGSLGEDLAPDNLSVPGRSNSNDLFR